MAGISSSTMDGSMEAKRKFIYVSSDVGARFTSIEDEYRGQVIPIMGAFHLRKSCTGLLGKVLGILGGYKTAKVFADCKTFGQIKFLLDGGSLHNTTHYIRNVLLPAAKRAQIREYLTEKKLMYADFLIDEFEMWKQDPQQLSFFAAITFFDVDLVALQLLSNGIRTRDFTAYTAGMLWFLPYCFAFGMDGYGNFLIRDLTFIHYHASPEVADEMKQLFVFKGKGEDLQNLDGLDGRLEETNLGQQKLLTGLNAIAVNAAALLASSYDSLISTMNSLCGHTKKVFKLRATAEVEEDIEKTMDWFLQHRTFSKLSEETKGILTEFDGVTTIDSESSPLYLRQVGLDRMKKWIPGFLGNWKTNPFPQSIPYQNWHTQVNA